MLQQCICRDIEHLGSLESTQEARVARGATPLSCSPNFPRAQYLDIRTLTHELIVKWSDITSRSFCFTLAVFQADLLDSPFRCFVWITKFTFPKLTLRIAQVLKEKWWEINGFAHSQTTNRLVNEAANDSARVSGQDGKKPPALGTNQIAVFGGFRPRASLEKNK